MNKLYVGFSKEIQLPKGGFLFIDDEVPDAKRARTFDPLAHSFNPLKGIDHRKARELADLLYTISPQGENTLTVRNGRRALCDALLRAGRLDDIQDDDDIPKEMRDEVTGMVGDLLVSPVLRRVLCNPTNFSFNGNSVILAPINRQKLGDFDALVLGLLLMAQFRGQVVCPDFGFYGRDAHASLIREGRLIAGCNFLAELPDKLRKAVMLIPEKVGSGAIYEDAELLAKYKGLIPHTNEFNAEVQGMME